MVVMPDDPLYLVTGFTLEHDGEMTVVVISYVPFSPRPDRRRARRMRFVLPDIDAERLGVALLRAT